MMDDMEPDVVHVGGVNRILPFYPVYLATQSLGVLSMAFVITWTKKFLGGFDWEEGSGKKFNWHPVFMVLAMLYLQGNAIIIFRLLKQVDKFLVKTIHTAIHLLSIIFTIVALIAVFQFHNESDTPNLYSFHSWIGLTTVVIFGIQFILGFIAYLFPRLSEDGRSAYLPAHTFLGGLLFASSTVSCLTGINEKLIFVSNTKPDGEKYQDLPGYAVVGNLLGVSIMLYAIGCGILVLNPHYRRPPAPPGIPQTQ